MILETLDFPATSLTEGTFEAANEQQAYEQLAQYGLNVTQVIPLDPPTSANTSQTKNELLNVSRVI